MRRRSPGQPSVYMDAALEVKCARRWLKHRDYAARNVIVTAHLKIAAYWAYRYRAAGCYEDLLHEGVLGLIRAADTFDPSRGYRFSTYAGNWVRSAVGNAAYLTSQPLKPSQGHKARDAWAKEPRSTAIPIVDDAAVNDDGGRRMSPLEWMPDGSTPPDEHAARHEQNLALLDALRTLGDRDQFIVAARYAEGATMDAVGRQLDMSRERVRQLEASILERLGEAVRVLSGEDVPKREPSGVQRRRRRTMR